MKGQGSWDQNMEMSPGRVWRSLIVLCWVMVLFRLTSTAAAVARAAAAATTVITEASEKQPPPQEQHPHQAEQQHPKQCGITELSNILPQHEKGLRTKQH